MLRFSAILKNVMQSIDPANFIDCLKFWIDINSTAFTIIGAHTSYRQEQIIKAQLTNKKRMSYIKNNCFNKKKRWRANKSTGVSMSLIFHPTSLFDEVEHLNTHI